MATPPENPDFSFIFKFYSFVKIYKSNDSSHVINLFNLLLNIWKKIIVSGLVYLSVLSLLYGQWNLQGVLKF